MRLRNKPWVDEAILAYDSFVFSRQNPPDAELKGRWREIFPVRQPLHLEIGTGKGDFITQMAERFPKINFIGLEAAQTVLYAAAVKVAQAELDNVRLAVFDARRLTDVFAPGEIDMIYLNFCDPWPKKRHAKRRLTYRDFLFLYREVLVPGGKICFKTDNAALFDFSLGEMQAAGMTIIDCTRDLHANPGDNVMTEYEQKFSARGHKICRAEALWPEEVTAFAGEEKILEQ